MHDGPRSSSIDGYRSGRGDARAQREHGRSAQLVGVARLNDLCGNVTHRRRGLVANTRVRPAPVIVGRPARDAGSGMVE